MTRDVDKRAMELFDQSCDLPESEREAFLDEHCAGDATLRSLIDRMILNDSADAEQTQLEPGEGAELIAAELFASSDTSTPERIGRYRVIREIGRGGMGVVYEAEQDEPRRRVAIKVMREGFASTEARRRFRREAHVLGQLQHRGIAYVYEAGTATIGHSDWPFFAMEFIDGRPLDKYADEHHLNVRQRLELIARVCDAVQHAHQKGVLHRDLKMANVLVLGESGTHTATGDSTIIDAIGQPKVLDFGVARLTDSDHSVTCHQTQTGQVVGTLATMSPEQLSGDPDAVDSRADVYALGVMTYALLADQPPHDVSGKGLAEATRMIREEEPKRLGAVKPALRGDIETIVAKSIDKDPSRRYDSASALADDVRRYLRDEPIVARPATALYQMRKFARRNKGLVAGMAATILALVTGLIAVSILLASVAAERDEATTARRRQDEVARFLASTLQNVDVQPMGRSIIESVQREVESWAARVDTSDTTDWHQLVSFLGNMDAVNIARGSFEVNLIDRAAATLDQGYTDDPVVEAMLRETVSHMYNNFYRFEKQLEQDRKALALRRAALGDLHPDTLRSVIRCANAAEWAMQFENARMYCREAIAGFEQVDGRDSNNTVRARIQLAGLLTEDDPEEAEAILLDVIDRLGRSPNSNLVIIDNASTSLANVYGTLGRDQDSIAIFEEMVERHQNDTEYSPWYLSLCQNLAGMYTRVHRYQEAEDLLNKVIDEWKRRFGDDHEATIVNRLQLAATLLVQGKSDAAEQTFRAAYASSLRGLAPGRSHRASAARDLAVFLMENGQLNEALTILDEAIRTRTQLAGITDTQTADLFKARGRCLSELGRVDESAEANRQAKWIRELNNTQ